MLLLNMVHFTKKASFFPFLNFSMLLVAVKFQDISITKIMIRDLH